MNLVDLGGYDSTGKAVAGSDWKGLLGEPLLRLVALEGLRESEGRVGLMGGSMVSRDI